MTLLVGMPSNSFPQPKQSTDLLHELLAFQLLSLSVSSTILAKASRAMAGYKRLTISSLAMDGARPCERNERAPPYLRVTGPQG
jgi:hypothetical protein